jgi:hypothetical protein
MSREKLTLTGEQARDAIMDDLPGYKVIKNKMVETGRWTVSYRVVIQRESDGKYFADGYRRGATEQQCERPWEFDDPNFTEVFKKEKIVYVYE